MGRIHAGLSRFAHRWRRALAFAQPHRRTVAFIAVLTVLLAGVNAIEPLILKAVFDGVVTWDEPRQLMKFLLGLVALGLLRELLNSLSNWLTWRTRLGIHHALLEETVGRLHRMPLRMQRSEGVGAVMTRLDRGIQGFIGAVTQILFHVFPAVIYLIVAVSVMMQLQWELALLVLMFTPLPAGIAALAAPDQVHRERVLLGQWTKIYSRFNEVLSGIVTVRSFAMEDLEKERFLRDVAAANRVVIRGVAVDNGLGSASNIVVMLARAAALGVGGLFVIWNEMSVGTLAAFLGYVGGLFGPVQGLTGIYQTLQRASVSLDSLFEILDMQDTLGDAPDAEEIRSVRGAVEFENVSFSYQAAGRPLIDNVSLSVEVGQTVAIVGPSGSGKTTLMGLLMRFYDPLQGVIRLDGRDLRTIRQRSLRRATGVVLQEPLLFNESIRSNIAYGRPEATMAEIEEAARAANAHDFISRLPERYETSVGERGGMLSVGERQRITIARALIKNPSLIILDEATSSLDAESEGLVQDALDRLMRGRTTFVIAHRLATVVNADLIIVLREGRISERGRHADLMRLNGYYATLVRRQMRGLISNDGEGSQDPAARTAFPQPDFGLGL